MNFLLVAINAKYIHSNPAVYSLREYAGAALAPHISLAEYTINQRTEQILADLYTRRPDVIGFSCYIWNWDYVQQLAGELRKLLPYLPIWVGGPEVSYEQDRVLQENPAITGIMVGEGEETFRDLVDASLLLSKECSSEQELERKKAFYLRCKSLQIRGTVTRQGHWGFRELLPMDSLPFSEGMLSMEEEKLRENRIVYYETSRGCPFRCSYCLSSIDKRVRLRSFALVQRELQYFLDRKIPQVKFIDRTFNCNHEHAKQIWSYLKEHDNGITNFHFEISADLLDEEELQILSDMRPGLIQLEIGVQTTNEQTLTAIHRTARWGALKQAVQRIHDFGNIHQHLDLIAGLPFEDLESFQHSFNQVYAMKPEQLQLGFLKVLKGSEMFEKAEEYGIVYQSKPPYEVLYTKWLSYDQILQLKKVEEMVELFYNSNQFAYTLTVLERLFDSPYQLYDSLARYFEQEGFFMQSPSRAYRYQILLSFVKEKAPDLQALFAELLTFDLYLRENAKSRPEFSCNLMAYKKQMEAYYKNQQAAPDILSEYVQQGYDSRQLFRMTHMDVFQFPVWDRNQLEKAALSELIENKEMHFLLFDYRRRSPITHEAHVYCVS